MSMQPIVNSYSLIAGILAGGGTVERKDMKNIPRLINQLEDIQNNCKQTIKQLEKDCNNLDNLKQPVL